MKRFSLCIFLIFTGIFLNLNAQIEEIAVDSTYVEYYETADAITVDVADYASDGSYGIPDDQLEKYQFKKGTPVFIVVNIQHSIPNDSLLAIRELRELQKNFKFLGADFLPLHKNAVLTFENQDQYQMRFDDFNTQYQSVIFWNGKPDGEVFQYESIIQTSEAYSPQLNVDKTSSYVDEFILKKEELSKYKNEKINQNSAAVSKKYISNMFLAEVYFLKNEEHFFNADFKGVKKLTVKSNYKGLKNTVNEAEFDQNGNPTQLILQSDDGDRKKINIQFSYLSGALKKMVSSFSDEEGDYKNEEEFFYQNGDLYEIFSDDGSFSKHYLNENGFLLSHSYIFDEFRYFTMEDQLTFKGKTLSYRDYGNLNNFDYTINSLENYFPVKVKLREDTFYEIKKISPTEFQIKSDYSSTKILMNEKGKIIKVITENLEMEDDSKPMDLIFEYFYEYY